MPRIKLSYNSIDTEALSVVLNKYENQNHRQIVSDFESKICSITGASHAVALASGTAAIHLALRVLGVSSGDYVIAPTFTYVATINPIIYSGAVPILIDSEPTTWNMDPTLLQTAIDDLKHKGKIPKAILLVHTYGVPAQADQILKIAAKEGIPVIEDAAESLGAQSGGVMTGTMGDVGIYSFNNNKMLTTFGGGMLVTKKVELASKARFLASQARENLPYYQHKETGYNYLMSPLNAAYGLSQLEKWTIFLDHRRSVFEFYRNALSELECQKELQGMETSRWLSAFLLPDSTKLSRCIQLLESEDIETRPLWNPMHCQPIYTACTIYGGNVSEKLFNTGICLPSGNELRRPDQQQIVTIIKQLLT